MIRVGILGCANIAKRSLAPAFISHPLFSLAAVASRVPSKVEEFISSLKCDLSHKIAAMTYEELIADENVDLVYCPLPTGLHYEWVKKSLAAGKHVLCEKSLACTFAEVEELVEIARARHLFLMESFQFRFHAQNLYVKELLSKRAIGELRQIAVRFGIPPFPDGVNNIRYKRELGGGALLDNGAYTIKCATYLLGRNVKTLAALEGGEDPLRGNVPLTGSIMMSSHDPFSEGNRSPICIQAAYGFDNFYQNAYEIWGAKGKILTARAFTAREDFAAPVILETNSGKEVKIFNDDHFARLMDYVAMTISSGDYENEYQECLVQAKILADVAARIGQC